MKRRLVSDSLMPTPIAPMTPALRSSSSALKPAVHHRLEALVEDRAILDGPEIDVVDQRDVDLRQSEPQMRMLQRAHDAVIGVVEHRCEARQAVLAEVGRRLLARLHGVQDAADLGRQHEVVARLVAQRRAHAQLAAAVAVERRGVEVAHATLVGGIGQRHRLGVGDGGAKAAHRRAAQAERRDFELRLADAALGQNGHAASCAAVGPSLLVVVRRMSRTMLRSSKRRTRCMVARLSHITRSYCVQRCE